MIAAPRRHDPAVWAESDGKNTLTTHGDDSLKVELVHRHDLMPGRGPVEELRAATLRPLFE